MPIYMDRHEVGGATPQEVAEAHQRDVDLQDRFDVKMMTYWYDHHRGSLFCLMDAPSTDAAVSLHREAHGLVANKIVEVEPESVQAFLGRMEDTPSPLPQALSGDEAGIDPAFRAIMFTDIEGSTEMATRFGDQKAVEALRIHNALTRDALNRYEGREIKHTGDGFMASFASVTNAVYGAIAIQKAFDAHNADDPDIPIRVRIGLTAGEPVEDEGGLFGSSVNLAARLSNRAHADQILVASIIRDLCVGKDVAFADKGEATPKGFDQPVKLYEVIWRE